MLHVRPAVASDLPVITGFIDEAAQWLADKGTDQWSSPWPDRERRDRRIKCGISGNCTWMVHDEGRAIGTISCQPDGDPNLWDKSELREPAVYVSRLIVCRDYGGQSIGNELFDWAGLWAAEQYGARWIRIDVWTTNTLLHDYYRKRGFEFVRQSDCAGYPSGMLFQKATADVTRADVPRLAEIPQLRRPAVKPSSLAWTARRRIAGGWRLLRSACLPRDCGAADQAEARETVALPRTALPS